ncbi:hypothetical protein HUJ05_001145 [Dendroctonus ponderosae]|nr:hypothetical protein HUJ05_001145 [Dendroctonus ponderosae]
MAVYPSCFRHLILLCTVVFVICSQQSISTVSDADVITTVGSVKPVSEPITEENITAGTSSTNETTTETAITTTTAETCGDTSIIIISETAFPTEIRLSINITTTDNGTFCPFTLLVNCTTINDWSWIISKSANFEFRLEEPISTVILDHLAKFTNYTCEFQQAGQLLLFTSFTTSEDVPSTPENVTVSAITPTSFNLSWTEPIEVPTVLFGYNITIQRGDVSSSNHFWSDCFNGTQLFEIYINSSAESLSYNFQNASADFSYDVSISAWSRIGNGNSTNINISTTSSASESPQNVIKHFSFTNTTRNINMDLSLSWDMPCNTNGPVTYFVIEASSSYLYNSNITSNNTYWTLIEPQTPHNLTIPNLLPASSYHMALYATNLSNSSIPGKNVNPNAPEVGKPLISARNITFNWSEPTNNPGNITGYNFNVDSVELGWIQTESCNLENMESRNFKLQDTIITIAVAPGAIYNVAISANTSMGQGNSTNIRVNSSLDQPELGDITYKIDPYAVDEDLYNVGGVIYFTPGCFNGYFDSYILSLRGERDGYFYNKTTVLMDYKVSEYDFSLRPEHIYTVAVTVKNREFNVTKWTNFSSPAGVPTFNEESLSTIEINTTTTEASLILRNEYFNSSYGTIRYLAIIISSENVTAGKTYTWGNESEWPIPGAEADIYYQATPKYWQPFEDSDSVVYVIGTDENCEEQTQFCNAPLVADKTYYVFVRVFNSNFYRNTMPIIIVTDALSKLGLILGIIAGFLAASIAGFIGFILWRRGIINNTNKRIVEDSSQETESEISIRNSDRDPLISFFKSENSNSATEIPKSKFIEYVNYLERNPDVLNKQWQDLEIKSLEAYGELKNHFALLPENKRKNRYGFSKKNQYIATQGPLPHTVRDFWKMIFQENVSMIVMVSRFIENRKEKCYKYFPNNHETMFIGDDLEVRCCTELYFEIYYDLKQLTVTHMQFMEWPDFDVPDGTSNLLLFCHQMRSRWANEGGLAVVHCSAGVGRTGTIIATDILTQGLATEKSLDVFNTVLELRKSRKSMVQSEKQYMYIYQLIKSLLEDPITEDDDDSNHLYANITVPSNHSIAIAESPL